MWEPDAVAQLVLRAMSGAPIGLAVLDRELRYVFVNDVLADFNGAPADEHRGRTVDEMIPAVAPVLEPGLRKVLATGEVVSAPEGPTGHDGDERLFFPLLFPVRDDAGEVVAVGGFVVETTERHRLEAELRQAQKMEALGRLAGGIAHDFNNLLTAIAGYAELALQEAEGGVRGDVEEIRKAAARARALTEQLLAFSRKQAPRPELVDLNDVLLDTAELVRGLIGADVELVLDLAPRLAPVLADRSQAEQVVMNLILNARDAMPGGGRLTIETANVVLDGAPHVLLAVADTGTGIDEAVQERLFEPFFTTKEPGRGTGLGLSTVYAIVKQSSGRIDVVSRPGEGARFLVYLPRAEAGVAAAGRPQSPAPQDSRGETVLVVEDEASVRAFAVRALQLAGYRALDAGTVAEALTRLDEQPVDAVVADVVLPGRSGVELAATLAVREPPVPVLFMSGHAPELAGAAARPKGSPFLAKPFRVDELTGAVRALLDDRR